MNTALLMKVKKIISGTNDWTVFIFVPKRFITHQNVFCPEVDRFLFIHPSSDGHKYAKVVQGLQRLKTHRDYGQANN